MERMMEKMKRSSKRVFINNIDSYASKWISKFLSAPMVGTFIVDDPEEYEEMKMRMTTTRFEIVGTVSDPPEEGERPWVLEEYSHLSSEELIQKLMECDVIIYNITQHGDQVDEASWVVLALRNQIPNFKSPKTFILLSTVMSWSLSKRTGRNSMELPFNDDDFRRRKAHPNFKPHIDLEKRVVKMGKTDRLMFSTYIVASGLQYGMGERVFHLFFKMAWTEQETVIPVFGDGKNIVPTIHINDLASVIHNIIVQRPKPYYLLAVDNSNNTMEKIVKAVACAFGPGRIEKRPFEEAFLTHELSTFEIDSMLVNLEMDAIHLKDLWSVRWLCETGLLKNMHLVVEEYRQTRSLLPIRICVMGPPGVGKSTVSERICEHYKLHHIRLKETITETLAQLLEIVQSADPEIKSDEAVEAQELLNSLKDNMDQNDGILDDQLLVKVMKDKLLSKPCRNQGFVLDGFPKTYEQAKDLFSADENEMDELFNNMALPEIVLFLDATDIFLKNRVINMSEQLVQEHNYDLEYFLHRLARYRERSTDDENVAQFFHELDITPLIIEITSATDNKSLLEKIYDTIGEPRNYGPSCQDVEEEERLKAEEIMRKEAQKKYEEEQKEAKEARERAQRWEDWTKGLEEVQRQEDQQLEAQSLPMRRYLMEHVMPTLTQGLIDCCSSQPEDPVDFLAQYLTEHNPLNY